MEYLVLTILVLTGLIGQASAQLSEGTGYKIGVTVGTLLAAIIFFSILGFLFYFLCVRKRLPSYSGGGFVGRSPAKTEKNIYRMGADPQPVPRDYQRYETRTGPPAPDYRLENNRHLGVSDYDREPIGRTPAHDQSVLTTSSYNSGPIVTNQYQQDGKSYVTNYQQQSYRATTQATKVSSAAYTGSSV